MQTLRTVNFNFPLFNTHETGVQRIQKVHEELAEVAWETADPKKISIQNLLLEAQDVMQAAIGVAYHGLSETMEHDKAVAILETLLETLNNSHVNKIETYKNQKGWTAL